MARAINKLHKLKSSKSIKKNIKRMIENVKVLKNLTLSK